MSVEKTGDWMKVARLIGNLAKEMQDAREKSLKLWGLKAEGLAKAHITAQDLSWPSLTPEYLASKLRSGKSENILVASSSYFQSITSWVQTGTVYAGVKKTAKYADGEEIADIAALHEFGSKSGDVPARELWQPTFKETMTWYVKSDKTPAALFRKQMKKYL